MMVKQKNNQHKSERIPGSTLLDLQPRLSCILNAPEELSVHAHHFLRLPTHRPLVQTQHILRKLAAVNRSNLSSMIGKQISLPSFWTVSTSVSYQRLNITWKLIGEKTFHQSWVRIENELAFLLWTCEYQHRNRNVQEKSGIKFCYSQFLLICICAREIVQHRTCKTTKMLKWYI